LNAFLQFHTLFSSPIEQYIAPTLLKTNGLPLTITFPRFFGYPTPAKALLTINLLRFIINISKMRYSTAMMLAAMSIGEAVAGPTHAHLHRKAHQKKE
jgi:hypothetical protein